MKRLMIAAAVLLGPSDAAHALTGEEIQASIDEAIRAGGGEVAIPPGTHLLTKGLMVKDARKLRITSPRAELAILKLPPLAFAEVAQAAEPGEARLSTIRMQGLGPGMQIQIEAAGEMDAFSKKAKPYHLAVVERIEGAALVLRLPLKFAVPAGTLIRAPQAPNLIEIRGTSDGVSIEGLTLDGGKVAGDPPVHGHAQLCGVFAQGPYSYEKGPVGPLVKRVTVSQCVIRNCHGRGVAFYAVENSRVEDCTITDTTDEAVDLDHFTIRTAVRRNHAERCAVGVELNDATDCTVSGNEFLECGIGINLWRWCQQPGLNEGNRITGNLLVRTKGNGMQVGKETANNVITGNNIHESSRNGITVSGARQVVKDNLISGSKLKDIAVGEPGALAE
jgi:hypothetical protein